MIKRRKTRPVPVGGLVIGGDNPVWVQSMTTTDPADGERSIEQIRRLEDAGCELIRTAVRDLEQALSLGALKAKMRVPLIADIHFDHRIALAAIDQGVDKIRINPGNIGGEERFREVVKAAKANGAAMRIGVNSGSLQRDLLEKHGHPTPEALAESALRFVDECDRMGYDRVVVSLKSSDVRTAVEACSEFSAKCDCPIHLGITEAGDAHYGAIKSAAGIGALLLSGIGDTIRVSLTGDPVAEIPVAFDILKACGVRAVSPEIISCPTCGRIQIDILPVVEALKELVKGVKEPLRISVMGCVVNGPGEAAESDIGLAGGMGKAMIYRKGRLVRTVPETEMMTAMKEEIFRLLSERAKERAPAAGGRTACC